MSFVAIARILRTRGLRGELVAELLTDFPARFENLKRVSALDENGIETSLELENHWFQKNRVILKFRGFDSIEAAENLRGAEICVPESEAVELAEDEFFDWQLQECVVTTKDGEKIGRVREIMRTGANEILVVEALDRPEKDFLIPFVKEICIEVDFESRQITIDPPEGLLGF